MGIGQQAGGGMGFGEVVIDRRRLGHDMVVALVVVNQSGDLVHRVDATKTVGTAVPVHYHMIVIGPRLVQRPARDLPAAHRDGVECEFGHRLSAP